MSERVAHFKSNQADAIAANLQCDHPLPLSDDDEDYIDMGSAVLNFYCTLVDLLGRCAPDAATVAQVIV